MPAAAAISEIVIQKSVPFAGGHAFGAAGPYERLTGIAKGELDPADPRNKVIVNLDKAPRNAAGKVEYQMDIAILRPADTQRGNRRQFAAP